MKIFIKNNLRPIVFSLIGAACGLIYYYFFACANGCPISSNPIYTALYVAVIGFLISQLFERRK